ncbi:hypothetical protein NXZ62_29150, partial [Klebsiella grimontii]|uniref:hypothetical protein n=1 Tax=Klebsiella grimontii TaxID=2058152 RepID=UPI002161E3A3
KPAVDVRHQTLAGRPETAWRVRRSLPHPFAVSGVWLDDRTRSGREPKVSPGLASQKETEEERKQQEERLTLSENRIRETKDLRSTMQ